LCNSGSKAQNEKTEKHSRTTARTIASTALS
jgi:hypothetical protein